MTDKAIKIASVLVSVAGVGLSLLSGFVSDKQLDAKAKSAVNESLKNR